VVLVDVVGELRCLRQPARPPARCGQTRSRVTFPVRRKAHGEEVFGGELAAASPVGTGGAVNETHVSVFIPQSDLTSNSFNAPSFQTWKS
jgi:hypothetical protein